MSLFNFLTKKSTLVCLAVLCAFMFVIPADVFAQQDGERIVSEGLTGPFQKFLERGSNLFAWTRNALFVCAAFAFLAYAWNAIQSGSIDWKQLLYLIVALVLLGVAGFIVSYLADPGRGNDIQDKYKGLQDTRGWD